MKFIAIAIALFTAALHEFMGNADTLAPALDHPLPASVVIPITVAWHMVTILMLMSIPAFWNGGFAGKLFSAFWAVSAIAFLVTGWIVAGPHGWAESPQWTLLLLGAITGWLASRAHAPKVEVSQG